MGWLKRLLGLERRTATPPPSPPPPPPLVVPPPPLTPRSGAQPPPRRGPAGTAPSPRTARADAWCEHCDMRRDWCVHGHHERQGHDVVFATRMGRTYHSRTDCNALTVPRAMSLDAGQGNSKMRRITRQTARQDGLEPCRICMGATRSGGR